jgi:hypothetical protein
MDQGCSLVETLVALSILSIVLAGCLGLFHLADNGIAASAKSLAMTALVESKIEALRAIPYQSLLAPDLDADNTPDLVLEDRGGGQFEGRHITQGILMGFTVALDNPVLSRSGAATIKVTTEWHDRNGQHRTVRFGLRRANPVYSGGTR